MGPDYRREAALMAIEEPAFELLERSGVFQLRRYAPRVVAETVVDGTLASASAAGFRRLARYIFGDNHGTPTAADTEGLSAAEREGQGRKIAMSAPVAIERVGGRWRVQFAMPRRCELQALPRPRHPGIALRMVPAQDTAVLMFSGLARAHTVDAQMRILLDWMAQRELEPLSAPQLARYNPPWTLPFLRRNEILIDYRKAAPQA